VDLRAGDLVRAEEGKLHRVPVGGAPNGMTADAAGRLWFCDKDCNAIRYYDPNSGEFTTVCERAGDRPLSKPNDLAFDAAGNCLFTCPNYTEADPPGFVCCVSPDGSSRVIVDEMAFPNGLALAPGGERLVIAETRRNRLWFGSWDARELRWTDASPGYDLGGPNGPDGMAFAADGSLYVAAFGSGCIKVVDAEGALDETIALPGARPTNCCFDPSGKLGLVVTEAETGTLLSLPELGPGLPLYDGVAWCSA
jgi:gluconolactonase